MSILVLPILPLRDVVVYPHTVIPLFVGRTRSIQALEFAMQDTKQVLLVTQKDASQDNPNQEELYSVGTVANVLQLLKLPDGTVKVLVEGIARGRINAFPQIEPFLLAEVESITTIMVEEALQQATVRSLTTLFEQYAKLNKRFSTEVLISLSGIDDPVKFLDTIAAHVPLKISEKQKILEIEAFDERTHALMRMLESEIDMMRMEDKISGSVERQIKKNQMDYYLREKMAAIQKQLGDLGEEGGKLSEINALVAKIDKASMPRDAKEKALAEVNKLRMMAPMAAEATVCRNYIDWMLAVPWRRRTKIRQDLVHAEAILNKEHYGLEKVKERILEYLAVQQRVVKLKGPILCLVGPPGVGKTSLGQSIARATGRKFVRESLGGVRDEAVIRGHRRTYVGALPGMILQKLAKAKVKNPLFLLDEVDKISVDFRGDPASALLEVLDPEQNNTFNDHYLEVDYDLSDVMFVATANSLNIPLPLLDRMEVIRLSGYTEDEKLNIAVRYLVPKQMTSNGLRQDELVISDAAILEIIRYYTREPGVRGLEREISKLCRKIVKVLLLTKSIARYTLDVEDLEQYLGVKKYRFGQAELYDQVGQVTGLAWTEMGGELLTIEAIAVPGKGKVISTGKLGAVMQESIQAARTVVRSRARALGILENFHEKYDIHIHVPEGATPKDGPSAGIGMCVALVSMLTQIPVRKDVAMTGEITLRGQVLPIGGLKEKLLAARRAGIQDVIIPDENMRDLKEFPDAVYQGMNIHPVHWIDEVLRLALARVPQPIMEAAQQPLASQSAVSGEDDESGSSSVSRH